MAFSGEWLCIADYGSVYAIHNTGKLRKISMPSETFGQVYIMPAKGVFSTEQTLYVYAFVRNHNAIENLLFLLWSLDVNTMKYTLLCSKEDVQFPSGIIIVKDQKINSCVQVRSDYGGQYIKYDTDNNDLEDINFGPFDIDRLYNEESVMICEYGKYEGRRLIIPTRNILKYNFTFRSLRSIDWTSVIDLVFMEISPCGKWMITSDGFCIYLTERNVRYTPRRILLLKSRHIGAGSRWINSNQFYIYMYMRVYIFKLHNYGVTFSGLYFDAWNGVASDDWRRCDYIFSNRKLSCTFDISTSNRLSYIGFTLEIKDKPQTPRKKQKMIELNNTFTIDWNNTKWTNINSNMANDVLKPYFCNNFLEKVYSIRKPPTLLFSFFCVPRDL